jgi:hypothetical protein
MYLPCTRSPYVRCTDLQAEASLSAAKAEHESALASLRTTHEATVSSLRTTHDATISSLKTCHDSALASLKVGQETLAADLRREMEGEKDKAVAEAREATAKQALADKEKVQL